MKSREHKKGSPKWLFNKTLATRRNGQLMLLLEMAPEFQNNISKLRKEFGIPVGGYQSDYDEAMTEKEIRKAFNEADKLVHKKLKETGYFMPSRIGFAEKEVAPESFEDRVREIGEKFHLPSNLYNGCMWGIAYYALCGQILVTPQNWEIKIETQRDGRLPIRSADIRAYAPLDKTEAKEAIAALNTELRQHLPEGLAATQRVHDEDEKNLAEIAKTIERRNSKGKGRTYYTGYLKTLHGKGDKTPKQMRDLERRNPQGIVPLPRLSGGERKTLERANTLALKLFGFGLFS